MAGGVGSGRPVTDERSGGLTDLIGSDTGVSPLTDELGEWNFGDGSFVTAFGETGFELSIGIVIFGETTGFACSITGAITLGETGFSC